MLNQQQQQESPSPSRGAVPGNTSSGDTQGQSREIMSQMAARNSADESLLNSRLAANRVNISSSGVPSSYRKGGKVRKTGVARLHAGERAKGSRAKSCR